MTVDDHAIGHHEEWSTSYLTVHVKYISLLCGHINYLLLCMEWPFKSELWLFWPTIFLEIKGQKHKETIYQQ
jgi:hypothetical protein